MNGKALTTLQVQSGILSFGVPSQRVFVASNPFPSLSTPHPSYAGKVNLDLLEECASFNECHVPPVM